VAPLPARALPGVGFKTDGRLRGLGVETAGQLRALGRAVLCEEFGAKLGGQPRHATTVYMLHMMVIALITFFGAQVHGWAHTTC
jgi:hypothetical protein